MPLFGSPKRKTSDGDASLSSSSPKTPRSTSTRHRLHKGGPGTRPASEMPSSSTSTGSRPMTAPSYQLGPGKFGRSVERLPTIEQQTNTPSIVVVDDASPTSPTSPPPPNPPLLRSFHQRQSQYGSQPSNQHASLANNYSTLSSTAVYAPGRPRPATARASDERSPFLPLTTSIPTGSMDDLMSLDNITFSNRGSIILLDGKKVPSMGGSGKSTPRLAAPKASSSEEALPLDRAVERRLASPIPEESPVTTTTTRPSTHASVPSTHATTRPSTRDAQVDGAATSSPKQSPKQEESFKPRTLKRITMNSRSSKVLSADEASLSQRVRSMYEHGTDDVIAEETLVEEPEEEEDTTKHQNGGLSPALETPRRNMSRTESRASGRAGSSIQKLPYEAAGGIEDWKDVDGQEVDRYGFIVPMRTPGSRASNISGIDGTPHLQRVSTALLEASNSPQLSSADRKPASQQARQKEWEREKKWKRMSRLRPGSSRHGSGMQFDFDVRDDKVINRTWKGIPDRWRATAWFSFLEASARKRKDCASEQELIEAFFELQEENSADDVQIDCDVPRTINRHIMFRRRYRGGQRLLFRVLHALSLYFPEVGYVQGMAALAATLLCYYDEEHTFIMMVRLWQLRGLQRLYESGFEGLMDALGDFEKYWLRDGPIYKKLQELGIHPTAYGTRWYLTLFNYSIPFPAQLRVWDVFMLLGDESHFCSTSSSTKPSTPIAYANGTTPFGADLDVLHATSAAIVDATREVLLDSDFENAMKVLTSWIPIKDEDLLMKVVKTEWKMRKQRAKNLAKVGKIEGASRDVKAAGY